MRRLAIVFLVLFLVTISMTQNVIGNDKDAISWQQAIKKIDCSKPDDLKTSKFTLLFPIEGKDPYHSKALAVFDHYMKYRWFKPDEIVVNYKGEVGDTSPSSCFVYDGVNELCSYMKKEKTDFLDPDLYKYGNVINFDGNPGWDYPQDKPEIVISSAEGIVAYAGWLDSDSKGDGYGLHVIIDHQNGYSTLYSQLSKIAVKIGDFVAKGQEIGLTGSTGSCTEPHLHFEVRKNNIPIDPYGWDGDGKDPYILTNEKLWESDVTQSCIETVADGHFKGEYWNGNTKSGEPVMVRDDGIFIDKKWGVFSPCQGCSIDENMFYVRWTKQVWFEGGIYDFNVGSSNGFLLSIDGIKIKSDFDKPKKQIISFEYLLNSGTHTITLECKQASPSFANLRYQPVDVPKVNLIYPNGYQIFKGGAKQTIEWKSYNINDNSSITISYWMNGSWHEIVSNLPIETNSFIWNIPNLDTTSCSIMIACKNDGIVETSCVSDNSFVIFENQRIKQQITIISPNDGEIFKVGSEIEIKWESNNLNLFGTITVYYYYASKWVIIGYNIPTNQRTMKWKIPNTPTTGSYILVQSFNLETVEVFDVSDKAFQIEQ